MNVSASSGLTGTSAGAPALAQLAPPPTVPLIEFASREQKDGADLQRFWINHANATDPKAEDRHRFQIIVNGEDSNVTVIDVKKNVVLAQFDEDGDLDKQAPGFKEDDDRYTMTVDNETFTLTKEAVKYNADKHGDTPTAMRLEYKSAPNAQGKEQEAKIDLLIRPQGWWGLGQEAYQLGVETKVTDQATKTWQRQTAVVISTDDDVAKDGGNGHLPLTNGIVDRSIPQGGEWSDNHIVHQVSPLQANTEAPDMSMLDELILESEYD